MVQSRSKGTTDHFHRAAPVLNATYSGRSGPMADPPMTEAILRRCRRDVKNPLVFFDIEIGSMREGKIVFELFSDVVPKVMPYWVSDICKTNCCLKAVLMHCTSNLYVYMSGLVIDMLQTAENFRQLCTGQAGTGKAGKPLHFKGCCFHRVGKYSFPQNPQ